MDGNVDERVVHDFGREWSQFDQTGMGSAERQRAFDAYFRVFPWDDLPPNPCGFDLGCGSGRWAAMVAPRVAELHCIDASPAALDVARHNLSSLTNCRFHLASVDHMPLPDGSMDFGYSLGVLHHVPDTAAGIRDCVAKLRPGAPFLLYLYYAFDNRPFWFVALWRLSDIVRRILSRMPNSMKYVCSQGIASVVYFPLARLAWGLERLGMNVSAFPLSAYRENSFYTMRTDALDRFGTRLEQRFTRAAIVAMMTAAGLTDIRFSDREPFWCVAGIRGSGTPTGNAHAPDSRASATN